MSDAFADLWNSSGQSKPSQPLAKAPSTSTSTTRRPQYDAFAVLASSGSSATPSPRAMTPSTSSTQKPTITTMSTTAGGDAFSSLLSNGFSSSSNTANLSMAERAALAEKKRREALMKQQETKKQQSAAWAGLDSLGMGKAPSTILVAPQPTASPPQDDDWLFGSIPPARKSPPEQGAIFLEHDAPQQVTSPAQDDDWLSGFNAPPRKSSSRNISLTDDDGGLSDFLSMPASKASTAQGKSVSRSSQLRSLWDDEELASDSRQGPSSADARSREPSRSNTPGDFDFGNREDGLLANDSEDEDDILGDLGKPADKVSKRPSPSNEPRASRTSSGLSRTSTGSTPPHIIGQIVEMGFTPQQARVALAATETGTDVQAALETLLANGAGASTPPTDRPRSERAPRRREQREERYDDEGEPIPHRRRRGASTRSQPSDEASEAAARQELDLQQQADRLLAQASEIGLSMFNKANAFWSQGKERAQKLYEERAAAKSAAGARASPTNGRPRWLQEALDRDAAAVSAEDAQHGADHAEGGFRDDEDEPAPRPPRQRTKPNAPAPQSAEPATGDLFGAGAESPQAYVSPFRRKTPARTRPAAAPAASPAPARAPFPIRQTQRQTVSASPSAIASSAKHKASGTEMFKLGRYAEAETAYSAALAALPDAHLLRVPLLNNRALTRLKTGDTAGAVADAGAVVELVGPAYHPAREAKVQRAEDGAGVDLGDALAKAWRRRAEAYEGGEKWELARKDWEALAGADFAGRLRGDGVAGVGRCRKMLEASRAPERAGIDGPVPAVRPRPRPARAPQPRRGPTPPSEALNRLREANAEADAEDQERHELKDSVDTRLAAWKNGKETNLRALIASLDTLLWPELGWQKVGLHELITPNQVKIRYTKAIAKLHPDKLNARNTTVEQRMIANGVFGSLNDAWNAFKP